MKPRQRRKREVLRLRRLKTINMTQGIILYMPQFREKKK